MTSVAMTQGCTAPMQVGLRPMLKEAAENQFSMLLKYGGEQVELSGEVSVISLHKQGEVQHKYTATGATSTKHYKNMPYAYLVPGDSESGRALCFFPENDFTSAAKVRKGQRVTLRCIFQEYATKGNDRVLVFNSCEVR